MNEEWNKKFLRRNSRNSNENQTQNHENLTFIQFGLETNSLVAQKYSIMDKHNQRRVRQEEC
jgi:hypothetical protein